MLGSTMAAEALSLQMAMSHAIYLTAVLAQTLGVNKARIPIKSFIDSNNLYQLVKSTKFVEDKPLQLDIAQIQECVQLHKVDISWVKADNMLADCMTKRGVKTDGLMDVIISGVLPNVRGVNEAGVHLAMDIGEGVENGTTNH